MSLDTVYSGANWLNYSISGQQSTTANIMPKTVSVSAAGGISKTYDGTTTMSGVNLAITGNLDGTGLTVSGQGAFNSAHVSRDGGGVVLSDVGYTLSNPGLSGVDAGNYLLSAGGANVSGSDGRIDPKTLTPTVVNTGVSRAYDGTAEAPVGFLPAYAITGYVIGDSAAILSDTGAAYNSAHVAAANTVTVSGLAISGLSSGLGSVAGDYVLDASAKTVAATITPLTLSASLLNVGVSKAYDGTTAAPAGFAPSWALSGLATGDTAAAITSTGSAFNNARVVGADKVTVSGLAVGVVTGSNSSLASDYVLDASSHFVAATVTPRTLTASLANAAVDKVYDGGTAAPAGFTPSWTLSGFAAGDTAAVVTSSGGSAYNDASVAGANKVTVGGLGLASVAGSNCSAAGDYALDASSHFVAATITRAPLTITALADAKTYDGLAYAGGAGVRYSAFAGAETASVLTGSLGYGGSSQGAANVGSYVITPSGLLAANYQLSYADAALTIGRAALTVSANPAGKTYDGQAYSGGNGVAYSGLVNGELGALLGGSLSFAGSSQGARSAGNYVLTPQGLSSGNYAISYADSNLQVLRADISAVAGITADNKVYDGGTAAALRTAGASFTGRIGSDVLSVATGKTISISGLSLAGADAGNYNLVDSTASATASPGRPGVAGRHRQPGWAEPDRWPT